MTLDAHGNYNRRLPFAASRERVFEALTTRAGLARWWTPLVAGDPTEGGQVSFMFDGVEEEIVMHVERARCPSNVTWSCLLHTGHPEWEGTRIAFELAPLGGATGVLEFSHLGLIPKLSCFEVCEHGWEHFLRSLVDYAEQGEGTPF